MENLLFFALIGAFCTLVAIGVAYTGLPLELCWRIASGILAFVMGWRVMVAAPVYRYIWSISPLGTVMSRSVAVFLIVTSSLVIALQLANALALLPGSSFVYLYVGLLWPLLAAGLLFYRVIFYRPGGKADSPAAEANED